jgi:hypothetical protein
MANFRILDAMKNSALDAAFGAAQNGGKLRIYDGTQPAGPATAITSQVLLATLTLNATAWAAASAGSKAANAITSGVAGATGTATWFRITDSTGATAYADGSVGTASADCILPTVSIVSGVTVSCSSLVVSVPVSA